MKAPLFFGLGLSLALAVCSPAENVHTGDTVAAVWQDGGYYMATVTAVSGDRVSVLYDDGDKATVDQEQVVTPPDKAAFKVGDHVLAAWKGARLYPGTITELQPWSCTVRWDDGDQPLDVKFGRVFRGSK